MVRPGFTRCNQKRHISFTDLQEILFRAILGTLRQLTEGKQGKFQCQNGATAE